MELEEKYFRYYDKLKELTIMHREFGFGENPQISSVFSENICKAIYNLKDWHNRDADAKNSKGKAIEIKATGSAYGTTTISVEKIKKLKSKFGGVYWLHFDFDNDQIEITFFEAEIFKNIIQVKERENISLNTLIDEDTTKDVYGIRNVLLKI